MNELPLLTQIKRAMQPTSLQAYGTVNLQRREREVMSALQGLGAATNEQIATALGWQINRVTGRMKALRDKGQITGAGVTTGLSGRPATVWKLKQ